MIMGLRFKLPVSANNGGFEVHINDAGTTYFNVITFNNTIQNNVILNKWYSLTMVVDRINNLFQFYVDGALVGSQPISSAFGDVDLGVPISIGYMSLWNSSYLDGLTDNLQIWDISLTQQEIQQYMNCPPTGNEAGLAGYWNFEEGSGTTALDLTPNGNNGTINGATYDSNVPVQSCVVGLTNANGCDSIAVLNLTINQGDTSYTNITACDSAVWNGTTYTQSGTYYSNTGSNNNYSMSFDGQNDYIDFGFSYDISNDFTWQGYFKIADINQDYSFFKQYNTYNSDGYYINYYGDANHDNTFWFSAGQGGSLHQELAQPFPVVANQWFHLAIVKDNYNITFFINGVDVTGGPNTGYAPPFTNYINTNQNLIFGSNDIYTIDGYSDNISVFNIALTQQEIQNYMSCPPTGNESGLVGCWNFEEGNGTTAYDQTANGNDGTINGATYDSNVPSQSCALTNANGCDSTAVLNLTINHSDTSYTNITACDSVVWNGFYIYPKWNLFLQYYNKW